VNDAQPKLVSNDFFRLRPLGRGRPRSRAIPPENERSIEPTPIVRQAFEPHDQGRRRPSAAILEILIMVDPTLSPDPRCWGRRSKVASKMPQPSSRAGIRNEHNWRSCVIGRPDDSWGFAGIRH